MPSQPFQARLAEALGVTPGGPDHGLDRTGVEVACAVRPGEPRAPGLHGKGLRFEGAALGALFETAELWAAEHVSTSQLAWSPGPSCSATGEDAWSAEALGSAGQLVDPRLWGDSVRCAWSRPGAALGARGLGSRARGVLPARGRGGAGAGERGVDEQRLGSAPGCAARAAAGAAGGDGAGSARPGAAGRVDGGGGAAAHAGPRGAGAVGRLARRRWHERCGSEGSACTSSMSTPTSRTPGAVGLPVAAAVLVDQQEGPVPLTAGYACALGRDEALLRALLEAAQSRLTDIHGAREDVVRGGPQRRAGLATVCASARPKRQRRRPCRTSPGTVPRPSEGCAAS